MKFKYLGTGAAEGIPALFCNCELCKKARLLAGKNLRSRSQALINNDFLIDFGPDTYWHVCRYNLDLSAVRTLLITHAHEDHYTPSELDYRRRPFAYLAGSDEVADRAFPNLEIYISNGSYNYKNILSFEQEYLENCDALRFHFVKAFEPFKAGKYTVTPLTAFHAPGFEALIYLVSDGEKTVLYAHDTGLFPEETLQYLNEKQPRIDFVSFDCTGMASGHNTGGGKHMNLERNRIMRSALISAGCAHAETIWCCNHFSHNGHSTHEELCEIMGKEGFLVAYDGMELVI